MNADLLLDAMNGLDDALIVKAAPASLGNANGARKRHFSFSILLAAALTLTATVAVLAVFLRSAGPSPLPGGDHGAVPPGGLPTTLTTASSTRATPDLTPGETPGETTGAETGETTAETTGFVTPDDRDLPPVYAIGHEHRTVTVPALPPTCTFPGRTACRYCAICSEVFELPEVLPPSGGTHSFKDGVCTLCGARAPSSGLAIEKRGEYAVVTGPGSCTDSAVVLPETYEGLPVTAIGDRAFLNCDTIHEIVLHDGIARIGALALSVRYENGAQALRLTIHDLARYCAIEGTFSYACPTELYVGDEELCDLILPLEVKKIPWGAFGNCRSLRSLCMTSFVEEIEPAAFSGCTGLAEADLSFLTLLSSDSIFADCSSLVRVTLPATLKHLGSGTFSGCSSLSEIVLPRGVERIGTRAFYGCRSLLSISFGDRLVNVGEDAFYGCKDLCRLNVASIASYCGVYYQNKYASPFSYARELFEDGRRVRVLSIPEETEQIMDYAFSGADIEELILPAGVKQIGQYAFSGCSSLKRADLRGLEEIVHRGAFARCSALEEVDFGERVRSIREDAFKNCASLKTLLLPRGVTFLGDRAFFGCSSLASIVLPDQQACRYGVSVFENCVSLERAPAFPGFRVGERMFAGCTSLREVHLPSTLTAVDREAFSGCSALEVLTFGSREKRLYLYENAFENCSSLTSVTLPRFLEARDGIFRGCLALTDLTFTDDAEEPILSPGWNDR